MAGIVAGAATLAMAWSLYLPMFEAPDEPSHFQYVAAIYSAGGLIRAGVDPAGYGTPAGRPVPDPAYLESVSAVAVITEHREVKAPAGYGTRSFYSGVDAGYQAEESRDQLFSPPLVRYYPFGYYALDAAFVGLLEPVAQSPSTQFFAARALSPLLLIATLLFTFGICRQLGLDRPRSLVFTGLVGFFPMTSFVAAAVQPDNLSAALVGGCLYTSLRLRRQPGDRRWTALLGLLLGALVVTKYQYALATAAPIVGMLVAQRLSRRRPPASLGLAQETAMLAVPAALVLLVQGWVTWGAPPLVGGSEFGRNAEYRQALADGPLGVLLEIGRIASWVVTDYILPGRASFTFWGTWLDAPIEFGSLDNTVRLWLLISGVTFVVVGLALWWLVRNALRLATLARRGRVRRALEIAFSNPPVNAYLLFTAIMIVSGSDQGRYWFPYLVVVFLVAAHYAPGVLPRPGLRLAARRSVLGGLVAFTIVGSVLALPSIGDRYYAHGRTLAGVDQSRLLAASDQGNYVALVVYPQPNLSLWRPQVHQVAVVGWAVDSPAGRPARTVFLTVDGSGSQEAVYGDDSPEVASKLGSAYGRAGFDAIIDTDRLQPGWHELAVLVVSADGKRVFAPGPPVLFELPCHLTSVGPCPTSTHHLPE